MSLQQQSLAGRVVGLRRNLVALLAAVAIPLSAGGAAVNPLEAALGFNVFVQDNMALGGGHVHGATAVGGDLLANGAAVFGMQSTGTYKVATNDAAATALAIGGGIKWSGSLSFGTGSASTTARADGNARLKISHGWTAIGNTANSTFWATSNDKPGWSSTRAVTSSRITTSAGGFDSTPVLESNSVAQAPATIARSPGIDFATQFAELLSMATAIGNMASSYDSLSFAGNTLSVDLKDGGLTVVRLDAATFGSINELKITGTLSATTGLIFDVTGANSRLGTFNLDVKAAPYVLYNFAQATSITLGDRAVSGSILAPSALLKVGQQNIDGQVIVSSFLQTNSAEVHDVNLALAVNIPEASTCALLLGAGGLGFVIWRRRRAAAARAD